MGEIPLFSKLIRFFNNNLTFKAKNFENKLISRL